MRYFLWRSELDALSVQLRKLRDERQHHSRKRIEGEQSRVSVVARVVRRQEEAVARRDVSAERGQAYERAAYRTIGKEVSHFFAGVYCAPPSICSHIVKRS